MGTEAIIEFKNVLKRYDYKKYRTSDVFRFFEDTMRVGSQKADFLCDITVMECDSIAMIRFGEIAAKGFLRFPKRVGEID